MESLELDRRRTAHLLELAGLGLTLRADPDRPRIVARIRLGTNAVTSRGEGWIRMGLGFICL